MPDPDGPCTRVHATLSKEGGAGGTSVIIYSLSSSTVCRLDSYPNALILNGHEKKLLQSVYYPVMPDNVIGPAHDVVVLLQADSNTCHRAGYTEGILDTAGGIRITLPASRLTPLNCITSTSAFGRQG